MSQFTGFYGNKQSQPPPQASINDVTYKRLCDETGVTDRRLINDAVYQCQKNGRADFQEVVGLILAQQSKISKDAVDNEIAKRVDKNVKSPRSTGDSKDTIVGSTSSGSISAGGLKPAPSAGAARGASGAVGHQDDDNDIQRAIAASLQDQQTGGGILGGQISREDQDISRVLEASLMEDTKSGTKRKPSDIWFVDPLNPHERVRTPGCPVGLKNVGNTCWFSAVIQSLFTVPRFRRLVLNYQVNCDKDGEDDKVKRNHLFVRELRLLFALMTSSRRKYVDPSRAVEILKQAFTSSNGLVDNQQDVSEFQHKLLEWLEDAFKVTDENTSQSQALSTVAAEHDVTGQTQRSDVAAHTTPVSDCDERLGKAGDDSVVDSNPMVELFYGQYLAEGTNEGNFFRNSETFGQFPLQVNGYTDIHDSLDAATAIGDIETLHCDTTLKSRQELWFTRLPCVLTFELSRFQFNQTLGRPEKIHNKLNFPEILYMDRYMLVNKDLTRVRRERIKKLNEELTVLKNRLEKFTQYGTSPKRMPIQDVLRYALDFARTKPHSGYRTIGGLAASSTAASPSSPTKQAESPMSVDSPSQSLSSSMSQSAMSTGSLNNGSESSPEFSQSASAEESMSQSYLSRPLPLITAPAPRHVTSQELFLLQECLQRWRSEVESDVKELEGRIHELDSVIRAMFNDADMKKFEYRLHAVLVHEGQAASGHYWAYVYNLSQDKWLKYNDITVTDSSWDEVQRESIGGYHNTSAYCLMYMAANKHSHSVDDKDLLSDVDLPRNLLDAVNEDNQRLAQEILDWDEKLRKAAQTPTENKQSQTTAESDKHEPPPTPTRTSIPNVVTLAALHSQVSFRQTLDACQRAIESDKFKLSPEQAIQEAVSREWKKQEKLAAEMTSLLPGTDPRLQHILVYTFINRSNYGTGNGVNAFTNVLYWLGYEQFVNLNGVDRDENSRKLREAASRILDDIKRKATMQEKKTYVRVHEAYYEYRTTVLCLVHGLQALLRENCEETMRYLHHANHLNQRLTRDNGVECAMDQRVISFYMRHTLLGLNAAAATSFEVDPDPQDAFTAMATIVVPSLPTLAASQYALDHEAADQIRAKWCQFLGQEIPDATKMEHLQDLLAALFEPPTDHREDYTIFSPVRPKNLPDLSELYTKLLHKLGQLDEIRLYH